MLPPSLKSTAEVYSYKILALLCNSVTSWSFAYELVYVNLHRYHTQRFCRNRLSVEIETIYFGFAPHYLVQEEFSTLSLSYQEISLNNIIQIRSIFHDSVNYKSLLG